MSTIKINVSVRYNGESNALLSIKNIEKSRIMPPTSKKSRKIHSFETSNNIY